MSRKKNLTDEDVAQIRALREIHAVPVAQIAEKFDASVWTIYDIVNYKTRISVPRADQHMPSLHDRFIEPIISLGEAFRGDRGFTLFLARRLGAYSEIHQKPIANFTLGELISIAEAAQSEYNIRAVS